MKIEDDDQLIVSGINVTPLVDIMMVLLIIFMVTASFVSEQGLKVELPKSVTNEKAPSPAITVALDKDLNLRLMKKDVTLEELKNAMNREAKLDPGVKVLLKAQKDIPYYKVAEVLDAIKSGGVSKVALAVEKK
jgi:biopolymer transport protein ExbD